MPALSSKPIPAQPALDRFAGVDRATADRIKRGRYPVTGRLDLHGMQTLASTATVLTLAADPKATNSIDAPQAVVPVTSKVSGVTPGFVYTVPANSIVVLVLESR